MAWHSEEADTDQAGHVTVANPSTATYPRKLLGGAQSYIQVDGWNLASAAK
jgi:hypothetical protein